MTPPRNAHIFAALPTYEDFKKYRSAFAWLHRHGHKQGQDGYDAALQTRLQERSRYANQPLPIPVDLINFSRGQLDSVASTVSERLQQLGATHTVEDAWASLQRDRAAGTRNARPPVPAPSTAALPPQQSDGQRSLPPSSSFPSLSPSSPITSSSSFPTSLTIPPVLQVDPTGAGQQEMVDVLTEMRELELSRRMSSPLL